MFDWNAEYLVVQHIPNKPKHDEAMKKKTSRNEHWLHWAFEIESFRCIRIDDFAKYKRSNSIYIDNKCHSTAKFDLRKMNVIRNSVLVENEATKSRLIIFTMIWSVIMQYKYQKTTSSSLQSLVEEKPLTPHIFQQNQMSVLDTLLTLANGGMWIVCSVFLDRKFSLLKQRNNNNKQRGRQHKSTFTFANGKPTQKMLYLLRMKIMEKRYFTMFIHTCTERRVRLCRNTNPMTMMWICR